jgi:NAD(P)-dependent dehydrogenase (short-subunit alcohol dehydrogenase family)
MQLNQHIVVALTGAGAGIGRALALALAAKGVALALSDLNMAGLSETEALIRAHHPGARISLHQVNVAIEAEMQAYAKAAFQHHGYINVLINNAGAALTGRFEECSQQDFDWIFAINLWGTVYGCRHFLPYLRLAGHGYLVNVSSIYGLYGVPGQSAYNASKFAVRGFSESLRQELRGSPLRLAVVHPGGIKTHIARRARVGAMVDKTPEELAKFVRHIERQFVTSPEVAAGQIIAGIEQNSARIVVGQDAQIIDLLQRITPVYAWPVVEWWGRLQARRGKKKATR